MAASDPDPVVAALNDPAEDAACLEALQAVEQDPCIAAALNDPVEDATCLEALQVNQSINQSINQ